MRALLLGLASSSGALVACRPDFALNDALVSSSEVLAVRAEPPEAKPGVSANYQAFVATPLGEDASPALNWHWCLASKGISENNVVSAECVAGSALGPAGTGALISSSSPRDACALFGPDTPAPGFRPRDADGTGGYYAPLRVDVDGAPPAFYLVRILCNLAEADSASAAIYATNYVPNQNPRPFTLSARIGGASVALDSVKARSRLQLTVAWSPEDAESYLYFDRASQSLVTRRESMRVAWHATSGTFQSEATGRAEDDPSTTSDNVWSVASTPGSARLFLVLRDSRGGAAFAAYDVDVVE